MYVFVCCRLNTLLANTVAAFALNSAEAFVLALAFNRMIKFVSNRAAFALFDGNRVYVSIPAEWQLGLTPIRKTLIPSS
jgi:hypothetical protein